MSGQVFVNQAVNESPFGRRIEEGDFASPQSPLPLFALRVSCPLEVEASKESEATVVAERRAGDPRAVEVDDLRRLGDFVEQVHTLHAELQVVVHRLEDPRVQPSGRFQPDRREREDVVSRSD